MTEWHTKKNDAYLLIGELLFISIFGIIGNIFILIFYPWNQKHSRNLSLFIKLLTWIDLATCVSIPYSILAELNLIQNDIACKILEWLKHVLVYLSVYTMVCCSIERYVAVCRPYNLLSLRQQKLIIVILFVVTFMNATPITVIATSNSGDNSISQYFKMADQSCHLNKLGTIGLVHGGWMFLNFVVAGVTMVVLYTLVLFKMKAQKTQVSNV